MIKKLKNNLVRVRNLLLYNKWNFSAKRNQSLFQTNSEANFLVSIASYPKRAHLLPAVFEALNKQTVVPKKWILVLSEEEWPNLKLPNYLNKLIHRGLEIVWVKNNTYAVKKLVPVIEKYPDMAIVTLDDDIIYEKHLLQNLCLSPKAKEGNVVGHVGKVLHKKDKELNMMFREKKPANPNTNPNQVFLIGWGGIYYPANALSNKVLDSEAITRIVPGRGSDIWFWAAAVANNTKQFAVESFENKKLGIPIPSYDQIKPKDRPGIVNLENRFQMTIDYFGIREKLLQTLPNKND